MVHDRTRLYLTYKSGFESTFFDECSYGFPGALRSEAQIAGAVRALADHCARTRVDSEIESIEDIVLPFERWHESTEMVHVDARRKAHIDAVLEVMIEAEEIHPEILD